ncbi:MAG: hypothetical protein EA379_07835 [Phycisphaerales bacterium]|nr:MAG: hypothetical protein EA379_07835 [Phycisphaerales bacterium]
MAVTIGVAACVGACSTPRQAAETVAVQREALERVAHAHLEDSAITVALASNAIGVARERLLTRIEDEIVSRYITPAATPDAARLREDAALGRPGALAGAINDGAMTLDEGEALLARYAATLRAGAPASERREAIEGHPAVRAFDAAAAALLDAATERARDVAALLVDIGASVEALETFAGARGEARSIALGAAATLWRTGVLERIDDHERRAAAERLLEQALEMGARIGGAVNEHDTEGL